MMGTLYLLVAVVRVGDAVGEPTCADEMKTETRVKKNENVCATEMDKSVVHNRDAGCGETWGCPLTLGEMGDFGAGEALRGAGRFRRRFLGAGSSIQRLSLAL
jgi:hypothetical protein